MYDELIKRLRYCRDNAAVITDDELMAIADQAADAIEDLSRENASLAKSVNEASEILRKRWIPVTERLPEQFKPVLVYYNRNGYSGTGVAEYYHDGDTKVWRGCGFIPTHWMPLPPAPKEEE